MALHTRSAQPSQPLHLDGAPNARDLSWIGWSLRPDLVLRSEALDRLTSDDVALLRGLRLRTVVDFRGENEIAMGGADTLVAPAKRIAMPVLSPDHDIYTALAVVLQATDGESVERRFGNGEAERIMLDMYRWFVSDPAAREPFATTLRLLADADNLPLLFHCTAGKDRTGWMAAIVYSALGVAREAIAEDFLASNEHGVLALDSLSAAGTLADPELVQPFVEVRQSYLDVAFDQVARDFGDFAAFLSKGLGVGQDQLEALRHNLLSD